MKTLALIISLFFIPFFALTQVGIGTVTPNAQLEITASNQAAPANTDGLLIPKIDEFPAINPTAAQNGMMVFATGSGTPAQGFYYWDNALTSWQNISTGAESINELSDGRSDNDGTDDGSSTFLGSGAGVNDDFSDNRNVGIGNRSMLNNSSGRFNVGVGYTSMILNDTGSNNTAVGMSSLRNNIAGNLNTAIGYGVLSRNNADRNVAVGVETLSNNTTGSNSSALGYRAGHNNNGDNNVFLGSRSGYGPISNAISGSVFIGYQSGYNETTSNKLYIDNSNTATPLIYGEFDTNTLRANGTFQIGDPSGTGYAFPSVGGAVDQVLQSDGAGNLSWVNSSSIGIDRINDLSDGRSDNDGTDDGSSIYLGVDAGMNDDLTDNQNTGIGKTALTSITTGYLNVAIGNRTLEDMVDGFYNTAVGSFSMASIVSGVRNVGVGTSAMGNVISGNSNTAVGYQAGLNANGGSDNVLLGYHAGLRNQGSQNVFLGTLAGWSAFSSNTSNGVYIGYYAGANEPNDNRLYIENSSSTTPLIYGEFDNDILRVNGSLQVGDPSVSGYSFPATTGAGQQVMYADGIGGMFWADANIYDFDMINSLSDGRSDNDGTNNGSSIFLGISAGSADDFTDNLNVGIGYSAMQSNTSGHANTSVGYQSMQNNTTGNQNTAFGFSTLQLANGTQNTAIGNQSMRYTTSGLDNVSVGSYSMTWNRVGDNNTAIGKWTLAHNEGGNNNSALGYRAGHYVEDGVGNTFVGATAGAGSASHSKSGSVFLGYQAGYNETTSNKLYIDNSSTSSPLIYGDFSTNLLRVNGTLNINSAYSLPATDGSASQVLQTDGAGNLSWANLTGGADTDWTVVGPDIERQAGNVYIGDNATTGNDLYINDRLIDWDNTSYYLDPDGVNFLDEISLDPGSQVDPSVTFGDSRTGFFSPGTNMIGITINNTERLRIDASGNVGINTSNPAYNLEVGGAIMLEDNAIPTHTAGHSGIFSRSGELYAVDSAGNLTVISPHHFELTAASEPMAWSFYSENASLGRQINVDMLKVVRTVESLSGETLVYEADLNGEVIKNKSENESLKQQLINQQSEIDALKQELAAIKALISQKQ